MCALGCACGGAWCALSCAARAYMTRFACVASLAARRAWRSPSPSTNVKNGSLVPFVRGMVSAVCDTELLLGLRKMAPCKEDLVCLGQTPVSVGAS